MIHKKEDLLPVGTLIFVQDVNPMFLGHKTWFADGVHCEIVEYHDNGGHKDWTYRVKILHDISHTSWKAGQVLGMDFLGRYIVVEEEPSLPLFT